MLYGQPHYQPQRPRLQPAQYRTGLASMQRPYTSAEYLHAVAAAQMQQRAAVSGSTSEPSSLLTGLEGYWTMNESSGVRYDSTDNAYDLTDNNTVGSAAGVIGNAASFVQANAEYLRVELVPPSPALAVSLWFYSTNISDTLGILNWGNNNWPHGDTSPFMLIRQYDGALEIYLNGNFNLFSDTLLSNTWYHVVVQYDGTDWTLWVDGSLVDTYTGPYGAAENYLTFGGGYSDYLDGRIGEAGVWSRALTTTEIADELYNAGAGKTHPF